MPSIFFVLVRSAVLTAAASLFTLPVNAQGADQSRVAVPEDLQTVPQTIIGFEGCYRVDQALYGPYGLSFCLSVGPGSYRVGGGLNCQGSLNWYRTGPDTIQIDLARTACGGGIAWTGDSMGCRAAGSVFSPWWNPFSPQPRVAVPDAPVPEGRFNVTGMRCNYVPTATGYWPVTVTVSRID